LAVAEELNESGQTALASIRRRVHDAYESLAPGPDRPALALVQPLRAPALEAPPRNAPAVQAPPPRPRPRPRAADPFQALVEDGTITRDQLAAARAVQARAGGQLTAILTSSAGVDAEALARGIAAWTGLGYVPLGQVEVDPVLAATVDEQAALRHLFLPMAREHGETWVAIADPFDARLGAVIREQVPGRVRLMIATAADIYELLNWTHGPAIASRAAMGLAEARPEECASVVMTRPQKLVGVIALVLLAFFLGYAPVGTVVIVNGVAAIFYEASALFRLRLITLAGDRERTPPISIEQVAGLDERELPIYTILVPLYREAAVVGRVGRSISKLDYPAHKLDVLMICEEDDEETIAAVRALRLGSHVRLIVVPDSKPKTKPKACNYALAHARGEMAVIFDAEDAPEPDQLKRVLLTLRDAPREVVCVQAKLDYGNADQNVLTRWFTAEYAMWFDLILPGLEEFDAPIPLGGTSNHFRTEVLRELGGWDPFNVTEDADLGVRLYKHGYKTMIVESTTFEEANSRLGNWIRQRSRWVKGHMQTWLVHSRHPIRTRRELGWRGWIAFQLTIGGSFFAALMNPIYWALIVVWFVTTAGVLRSIFPSVVYYGASANLLLWNFAFVYAAAAGVARRGYYGLVRAALYSPIYWALISVAAWKGALQLITKPFYWEKTVHGLDRQDEPAQEPTAQAEPGSGR
jgi:cellulose synthase/poly-beta-1,6-N-acetylglucosamine synthase-like glycosyltransferase